MLKIIALCLLLLAVAFVAFLFYQGRQSIRMMPPAPDSTGQLPACSNKPNCVSSQTPPDDAHYIAPISAAGASMDAIRSAVENDGGTGIAIDGNLLTAIYKSRIFGFIDDVMLLKTDDLIQVRSSSRVGYSDFDANRKRIERLRQSISAE